MGRITSLIRKDIRAGMRDSLLVYMVASPLLLAVAALALLPLVSASGVGFAVEQGLDPAIVSALESHGSVEVFPDAASVEARVLQTDHVVGALASPDGALAEVVREGNEPEGLGELPARVAARALDSGAPEATVTRPDEAPAGNEALALTMLLFMVALLPGFAVGLVIMNDRETGVVVAYNASPMRFSDYAASKTLEVLGLVVLTGAGVALITSGLGSPAWGAALVALVASSPVGILLGILLGALARDQLTAIAYIKGLSFVFASLPLAGFVATEPWVWAFWLMPNYWSLVALFSAASGDAAAAYAASGWAALTSLPLLIGALLFLRRRLEAS